MGMPGSGKGTQAQMLARDIEYKQFSTGNAFRQIALEDSDFGREVKRVMESGLLTSPAMATEVVIGATKELVENGEGIVFDGTPRTLEEAKSINEKFIEQGYGVPLVIYLEVDKNTMIERNSKRRLCLNIDTEFPVTSEKDEERCASLGGKVGTRPDDEKEKFTTRYNQFMELTYPAIALQKELHPELYFTVDGMDVPHRVHASVMDVIGKFEI